jgi:sec-independent protein translocase protein TatA
MMGDVAKGLKSFKKGLSDDEDAAAAKPASRLESQTAPEKTAKPVAEEQKHG